VIEELGEREMKNKRDVRRKKEEGEKGSTVVMLGLMDARVCVFNFCVCGLFR